MDVYTEKGYTDRRHYLKWLAERHRISFADVNILASEAGPEKDFTELPKLCERKGLELAPDPYRYMYYNGQADYFNLLSSTYALPVEMIAKEAEKMEPADHFDKLLDRLQEVHDDVYSEVDAALVDEHDGDEDMEL